MKILQFFLNAFSPIYCVLCGEVGKNICDKCLFKINFLKPYCHICEKKSKNFSICEEHNLGIKKIIISFPYNKNIAKIIKKGKYSKKNKIFDELGTFLSDFYLLHIGEDFLKNSVLVPIPLHFFKKCLRGFNQTEIFAKSLSKKWKIPVENLLKRKKYTISQSHLDKKNRIKNIKNAFCINKPLNNNKNIILIDDIFSTGSTIFEAVNILQKHNYSNIVVLCIATRKEFDEI